MERFQCRLQCGIEYSGGWASRNSLWSGKGLGTRVEAGTRLWYGSLRAATDRNPPTSGGGGCQLAPEMVSEFLLEDGHERQVFLGEHWDPRDPTVRTMNVNPLYELNNPIVTEVRHF